MKTSIPIFCARQRSGIMFKLFSLLFSVLAIQANAQNYLSESFDGSTSPPTGWTSTYIGGGTTDGSGCGCNTWYSTGPFGGNPSAPTHTGSGMATFNSWSIRKTGEAVLITPAMDFSVYTGGANTLSFWLYKSDDFVSGWSGNEDDSINVWINTSAGLSGATYMGTYMNGIYNTPTVRVQGWYQYTITIPSSFASSSSVYVIFDGVSDYESDLYLDDVSVDHIPPCTGVPSVSLVPSAGNIIGCSGGKLTLNGTGGVAMGQDYQWQQASSPGGPWSDISGATTTQYVISGVGATHYYRLKDSCEMSGLVGYSLADTVGAGHPPYASIPFAEDFENWQDFCDTHDVPSGNWMNTPSTGDGSWRREDEGCSIGGWATSGCTFYNIDYFNPSGDYYSGSHAARFHSSPDFGGFLPSSGTPWSGTLDLYIDCSGPGNKLLQFFFKNQVYPYGVSSRTDFLANDNDSLDVFLSTDGGLHFSQLWGADTAENWKKIQVQIPSTSATTVIRFLAKRNGGDPAGFGYTQDLTDIGLDSVLVAPACTGLASGGAINPSGEMSSCNGASYSMDIEGVAPAGGITYQWQMATPSAPTFTNIPGQTGLTYTTPPLFDTVLYQVTVSCPYTSPATTMTSAVTQFDVTPVPYAAINLPSPAGPGYHFSFESWNDHCATTDQPVVSDGSTESNWINYPADGLNTWRRDDEGYSAGWWDPWEYPPYEYSPVAYDSSHSARLSTNEHYGSGILTSHLYLFLDCSTVSGTKELQYYTNIGKVSFTNSDTIATYLSTDGGLTFSLLRKDFNQDGTWQFANAVIPSNSATTVIDFQGIYGNPDLSNTTGLGLDDVRLLLPCDGKPTAGVLVADTVCANAPFKRELIGTTMAAGLWYDWQQSADSIIWTDAGDTTKVGSFNFSSNTYLRCIVKCKNSGLMDTSNVVRIIMKPFYKCYCNPVAGVQFVDIEGAIGNFSITDASTKDTLLDHTTVLYPITNNPWADELNYGDLAILNGYTDFTDTLAPATVFPDSLYNFYVTQVSPFSFYDGGYPTNIYIDYDHSGTFDPTELAFNAEAISPSAPTAADSVRIPIDAQIGLTGMRVLVGIFYSSPLNPCGNTFDNEGEIRDYLINIDYRPCNGKPSAGIALSTDSIMCDGYTFTLSDTTHEQRETAMIWNWQYSPDGSTWGDMPGTVKRDTLTQLFTTTTWYRLRIVCQTSNDTSYSNVVKVKRGEGYQCYCFSEAIGGTKYDSSDIGAFTFGSFIMNKKGPHLLNPAATAGHAGYVGDILDLDVDTTYAVGLYHILHSATHADAKITLFIDYNNSHNYDVPDERVWTAYTSASDWYLTTSITIPDIVITDVPTGMRLILNNNTAANVPSDDACGAYTSGETIDFVVRFNREWTTGVGDISNLQNLVMYPNPSDGKFKVSFSSQNAIKDLSIRVSNMTGQEVYSRDFHNTNGQFSTEIDLGNAARGVYFVTFIADGEKMIRKMVLK